jgi:hypothetical protein
LPSNAYKHSGLDVNTSIDLSVIREAEVLSISCANVFHERVRDDIQRRYPDLLKAVRQPVPKSSHIEGLSGFKKIMIVASRVFKSEIKINITPPSYKNRTFRVEIELYLNPKRLFVR